MTAIPASKVLDRALVLEMVRVTEAAAIAAYYSKSKKI